MKLVLLVISLIAAVTVNCRSQPGPSIDEHQNEEILIRDVDDSNNDLERSTQTCKAKNSCILLRGSCVTNATECRGRLEPNGCRGANCQCCIKECPDEFFTHTGSELQCFKLLDTPVNWNSARSNCHSEGLKLAKPYDAIATRDFIMERFGNDEKYRSKGTLTSPNYPSDYTNSRTNAWTITAGPNSTISVNFEVFNTENHHDRLIIRDGGSSGTELTRLSGSLNVSHIGTVNSTTNSLYFYFQTDGSVVRSGYKLNWSASKVLGEEIWVDGRGDGSNIVWQRNSEKLSSTSSLWFPGHPGNLVSTSYCLSLETANTTWKSYPNQPYAMEYYYLTKFPLCELLMD